MIDNKILDKPLGEEDLKRIGFKPLEPTGKLFAYQLGEIQLFYLDKSFYDNNGNPYIANLGFFVFKNPNIEYFKQVIESPILDFDKFNRHFQMVCTFKDLKLLLEENNYSQQQIINMFSKT